MTKNEIIETAQKTPYEIPQGQTEEDIRARAMFIVDYYNRWTGVNPERRIFNARLEEFVYMDCFPIGEIAPKAAQCYHTTLAITYLTEILECAAERIISVSAEENDKQYIFTSRLKLLYHKPCFGTKCLTLDTLKREGNHESCHLTAIEKVK